MDLKDQLRGISWMPLDVEVDAAQLLTEYQAVCDNYYFAEYQTTYPFVGQWYARSWSGICLSSSDGCLYTDLNDGDVVDDIESCKPTELVSTTPYMYNLVDTMSAGSLNSRARIMRIAPHRSLVWHSHVLEHGQSEYVITIQVPIYMPTPFDYCVVDAGEFKWYKRFYRPNWFKSLRTARLEPGQAYYFNSYHHHNVYNGSDEYRATLMLYLDIREPAVAELVERSIAKYR